MANSRHQETEGVLSPWVRSARLKQAASLIPPNSVVLDLACGAGYLHYHLPPGCHYIGVDRLDPPESNWFHAFLQADLAAQGFFDDLARWLPKPPDVVTLLAFLEHVKEPDEILRQVKRIVKPHGTVVITTPHPIGRTLHDSLARLYLCSRAGAAEHERFLDKNDLVRASEQAGFSVRTYRRFLFGLNQLVELRTNGGASGQL
jgi:2-polyprenyl-3-methyl-5-hydroxy-6-metoxy-1,4-benzoquinol methylase